MKIKFSKEARKEILDAKFFYTSIQPELGKKFSAEIKALLKKIERNPYFATVRYENIRAPRCKIFPFSIHYFIDIPEKTVLITSVFHTSRNPFWLKDISDDNDE